MMREKMYTFKKNHETGAQELVNIDFNFHESLTSDGKVVFNKIFTREYARCDYFKLRSKIDNNIATPDDVEKLNLLESEFEFDHTTSACTDITDTPKELVGLMMLTLFAHNVIISDYSSKKNDDCKEVYKLKFEKITLGLDSFYNKCKTVIPQIKTGATTLENSVDTLKPLYNDCTTLINHEAANGLCKKWVESKKEKNTRAFITGLLGTYKLNRNNRIDEKSPLKSQIDFEKYVVMWLVTGGVMVDNKKKSGSDTKTMSSIIANLTK